MSDSSSGQLLASTSTGMAKAVLRFVLSLRRHDHAHHCFDLGIPHRCAAETRLYGKPCLFDIFDLHPVGDLATQQSSRCPHAAILASGKAERPKGVLPEILDLCKRGWPVSRAEDRLAVQGQRDRRRHRLVEVATARHER